MTVVRRFIVAAALAACVPTGAQAQGSPGKGGPEQRVEDEGAQTQGAYRDFHLGASTKAIVELTETRTDDVRLIHERPALMQELRWMPSSYGTARSSPSKGNGVEQIVFSFYENQLSRIAVDYERSRTRGLTDRDIVDELSAVYGATSSSTLASTGDAAALPAGAVVRPRSIPARKPESMPRTSAAVRCRAAAGGVVASVAASLEAFGVRRVRPPGALAGAPAGGTDGSYSPRSSVRAARCS